MWQFETSLLDVIRRTREVKTFRFDAGGRKDARYKAGQYFYVTIKSVARRPNITSPYPVHQQKQREPVTGIHEEDHNQRFFPVPG